MLDKESIHLLRKNRDEVGLVLESSGQEVFQREINGSIAGVAVAEEVNNHTLLHQIVVKEEFRGEGIGTSLVRSVEKKCINPVEAKVHVSNSGAQSFFQSVGWTKTRNTGDGLMQVWRSES